MRRVRVFHEHLVRFVLGEDSFLGKIAGNAEKTLEQRSLETAATLMILDVSTFMQAMWQLVSDSLQTSSVFTMIMA